jgi:excisionase family DNA binding protein
MTHSQDSSSKLALSTSEAAARVSITPRHLRNLISRGERPEIVRLGRRVVIRLEALVTWISGKQTHAQ